MRVLILLCFFVSAWCKEPVFVDYHEEVGIPEAARIKKVEDAIDFDGRIIGGSASSLGAHPYMAGLVILLTSNSESVCGASLLSNTKLVTAAHCWRSRLNTARQFTVVLASVRLFSGGVRSITSRVVMHPQYNIENLRNDVAVITINSVAFTSAIAPITLASGSALYTNQWPTAIGFGRTSDTAVISQNSILRQVNLRVISNAECRATYGWAYIVDSSLCTDGGRGTGTCGGDSGGPLVVGSGTARRLIGITSFGSSRGCQVGAPSVFARVTWFNSWIRGQL
ncbi:collagenase-like [Zerene cesonia]|uniref:collagenase-like n=1 Tax=Zerene cesonia TaxID=33412 RepID=UPI0018E57E05|nr:collagenase-like [Zerene cesonia]